MSKICARCVLDQTVDDIIFNDKGICNYCNDFEQNARPILELDDQIKKKNLDKVIEEIKRTGKNRKYDCILGISGGVDSSYLALLVKKFNLRTLLVHFDNGWNSELAVKNIEKIIHYTGFDLHTVVIEWESFKNLQKAYIKSSVLDIEVPTDHLIVGALYSIARKKNIKTIISGTNISTEYIMPKGWNFPNKGDFTNLRNIFKKYGEGSLSKLTTYNYYSLFINKNFRRILSRSLLNHMNYSKEIAKSELKNEFGWKDYGGKHFESIFTRFYQGYILPRKFNIDKRKAHLSTLICSGQISRKQALEELKLPTYDINIQKNDLEYVLKKLEISAEEFNNYINEKGVDHEVFGTEIDSVFYDIFNKLAYFLIFKIAIPLRLIKK